AGGAGGRGGRPAARAGRCPRVQVRLRSSCGLACSQASRCSSLSLSTVRDGLQQRSPAPPPGGEAETFVMNRTRPLSLTSRRQLVVVAYPFGRIVRRCCGSGKLGRPIWFAVRPRLGRVGLRLRPIF